jgi:hypothetical protein
MALKSLQVDIISNIYVCFLIHLALAPYNFKKMSLVNLAIYEQMYE